MSIASDIENGRGGILRFRSVGGNREFTYPLVNSLCIGGSDFGQEKFAPGIASEDSFYFRMFSEITFQFFWDNFFLGKNAQIGESLAQLDFEESIVGASQY